MLESRNHLHQGVLDEGILLGFNGATSTKTFCALLWLGLATPRVRVFYWPAIISTCFYNTYFEERHDNE